MRGRARSKASVEGHFASLADSGAWVGLYEGPETAVNMSFRVRLRRTLELLPLDARRVLDVGCGPAPLAGALRERAVSYVGVDFVQSMLRQAQERYHEAWLVRGNARLPFRADWFDAVVGLGFLEYLHDVRGALGEMRRVVRPGGTVVVSIPKRLHVDTVTLALTAPLRAVASFVWGRRSDRIRRTRLSAAQLDRLAAEAGLRADDGRHYHFTPLPYPLTVLSPSLALRAGRSLENSPLRRHLTFLAHGYLGRYRRD